MKLLLTIISMSVLSNLAFANMDFVYTSLKFEDCVAINASYLLPEEEQDIDYYDGVCPSFGGYQIGVSGGDIRYSVTLSYNGTEIKLPRLSAFHDTGDLVEWRYERNISAASFSNEVEYRSLIYRLKYSDIKLDGQFSDRSMLVVVRLNQENSCVIGLVHNQANMNELARAIADDMNAPCLTKF